MEHPDFGALAANPEASLDGLALALASSFRVVDIDGALAELDRLGGDLADAAGGSPREEASAIGEILGIERGFVGNRDDYDHPDNSMLDLVLARRTGLPILLSVVYVEAARRAGIRLSGVGLPGHFVVGHFGEDPAGSPRPVLSRAHRDGGGPVGRRTPLGAARDRAQDAEQPRRLIPGSRRPSATLSRPRSYGSRYRWTTRGGTVLTAELRGLQARLN